MIAFRAVSGFFHRSIIWEDFLHRIFIDYRLLQSRILGIGKTGALYFIKKVSQIFI